MLCVATQGDLNAAAQAKGLTLATFLASSVDHVRFSKELAFNWQSNSFVSSACRMRCCERDTDGNSMNMSNFDQTRLHGRRKIAARSRGGDVSKGDPKMDGTRRAHEATHVDGDVVSSARRPDTSELRLTDRRKVQTERVLSLDSVMDDMRAILWSDRGDQEPTEIDFVATASAPE